MKKERKPKTFLQGPSYPGGPNAMRKFLSEQIKYPAEARKEKIVGTVRLRLDINHQGKVSGAKVLTSLGHGCDEEALRVVKLLKFEVPKQRKIKAVFHKTMNIHFKHKEDVAPAPQVKTPQVAAQQLNYTVTTQGQVLKGKVTAHSTESETGGYHYTIEI